MSRNLVIFCDGTWNSPEEEEFGQSTETNVHKLFASCQDEAQSNGAQITWYQPGVGSDGNWFRRAFEGATGTGTGMSIRRGYAAIATRYQAGDRIILVGFSRGAFTARSIAGMIEKVGLLKDASRPAVERAYDRYRRNHDATEAPLRGQSDHPAVHQAVRIHAIGAWDTVGALGLSIWGWSFNIRMFWRNNFHRLSANRITDHVFHALAFDEKRTSFVPVLWNKTTHYDTEAEADHGLPASSPAVEEAWFRGVHSDIGGGYADARLSDITLRWMAKRLGSVGLLLRPNMPAVAPSALGRIHDSARGPLWTNVATWPRWAPLRTEAKLPRPSFSRYLHQSVADREVLGELYGLAEQRRRWLAVGETYSVVVRARHLWDCTGVVLEPGAQYELRASGSWQDSKDTPVGPEGQLPREESLIKRLSRRLKRVPEAHWFELIALPCYDFGWSWRELGLLKALYYLLIDDPIVFKRQYVRVGRGCTVRGPTSGEAEAMLWAFANDARKFYSNNTGSVLLEITRMN